MEKIYDESMIRRVQEYMETHKISQNQMASKVNISSAALSSYMNQKYKGSVETVERQLKEFFAIAEESAAAAEKTGGLLPRESYIPTSISETCTRESASRSWNTAWWSCTGTQAWVRARARKNICATTLPARWASVSPPAPAH